MTQQGLIKKLTQLKKVKPDKDWVIFCRQNLTANIGRERESERAIQGLRPLNFFGFLRQITLPRVALRPAVVFLVIFGFICSTGLVSLALAEDSLPGDRLYPVKIALEQARLLATTSADDKAELHSKMMAIRIQELSQIIEKEEPNEEKERKMEEAVINLQKQLISVKEELPKLEKTEAKRVVELAKKIDAEAVQAAQTLAQAKTALAPEASQTLAKKLAEAVEAADTTSTNALGVMVEKQNEAGEVIDRAEIEAKIEEKIQSAEQKINKLEEEIDNSAIGNQFPKNEDISLMIGLVEKAKETLNQAEETLLAGDTAGALQKITLAAEFIKSAESLIENFLIPLNEPDSAENNNATGTPESL